MTFQMNTATFERIPSLTEDETLETPDNESDDEVDESKSIKCSDKLETIDLKDKEENILFNEDIFRDVGHLETLHIESLLHIEELLILEEKKALTPELINVSSDFNKIELNLVPPKIPFYDTILITHIKTKLSVSQIIDLLVKGFNHYSISYNKNQEHKCGLECYVISNSSLVNFIVSIYLSDDETEHIVEFTHWQGCRYEYGSIILNLTNYIGLNIITGWTPMLSKPPWYNDLETTCELPDIEIDMLSDLIENSCLSDLEYHLTTFHSMILSKPFYFEKNGKGTELIDMLFILYKKYIEYKNYKILIYDAICNLSKIVKLDVIYIEKIIELNISSLFDSDQHIIESTLFGLSNIINIKGTIQLTEKQKSYIRQYSRYTKTSISTNALHILSKL